MFDTYYYIDELEDLPENAGVHVTGGRFHPVPGNYYLPCGEGTY